MESCNSCSEELDTYPCTKCRVGHCRLCIDKNRALELTSTRTDDDDLYCKKCVDSCLFFKAIYDNKEKYFKTIEEAINFKKNNPKARVLFYQFNVLYETN